MALLGSPMTRAHIPALWERGIRMVFFDEYELINQQYETVFKIVSSQKRQETDVIMAGLGTFQPKAEGRSPVFDNGQQAYTRQYVHNTWALGLEITEEGIEDDLYDYYRGMSGELGKAAGYTEQVEAFDVFNDLSLTTYTAGGTAYPILSTSHYRVDGGTWSNKFSVSTDLSVDSLQTGLTAWRTGMVDQRGRKVTIKPEILMVGASNEWVARTILETDGKPGTTDNDKNVVRTARGLKLFVCDYLVDDGRWFLLAAPGKTGLRYNRRIGLQMRNRDDPSTGNLLKVGRYRESHGASHPWGIYGSD